MGNPSGGSENPKSASTASVNDIDASVGGLVWVRRRNGSWWPGRIVGLDEVSDGCLVSPRSGTPVKLLGRDDASVDWYNLEKSKRVKAFRCGEFDECIAKAKAAAANAGKKAVKYARREDAVLHALELESAQLGRDHPDYFSRTDNSEDVPEKSHSIQECEDSPNSNSESGSDSAPALSQSGISFEESNHIKVSQEKRRKTPNDSEDDGTEKTKTKTKRMKGLEDLGMVVGSKRQMQTGAVLEPVQLDNTTPSDSNPLSNGNCLNGNKNSTLSFKRRRSQAANVHDFLKRKNRRKQLTKVLESTAVVSVPVLCDQIPSSNGSSRQSLSDSKVSGMESNESGKSLSVVVNNNSDSIENEAVLQDSEHVTNGNQKIKKENEITSLPERDPSDGLFDVPLIEKQNTSAGVSPVRDSTLSERVHNAMPGENSQLEAGVEIEKTASKWQTKGKRKPRHNKNRKQDLSRYAAIVDESNNLEKTRLQSGTGFIDSFNEPPVRDLTIEVKLLSDDDLKPLRIQPSRQSRYTVNSKYQSSEFLTGDSFADSKLFNVRLDVKASYRPQDVPLVSLMSKLNGKAVVGHPLTIDASTHSELNPVSVPFNAGKRRVSERNSEPKKKKRSYSKRRSVKMKKSGALSKKTRKLSSLTGQGKINAEKKPFAGKSKGPVIACVPLNLVFSRINEAVNGSARPTQRAQPSNMVTSFQI